MKRMTKELKAENITLIQDTREQAPLNLSPFRTLVKGLKTGDYSILGLEDQVAMERKSLPDLIGCVGQHRERFDAEMKRLEAYPSRAIVVEAPLSHIYAKSYRSKLEPNVIVSSLMSWMQRTNTPIFFCDNRMIAQDVVKRWLWITAKHSWDKLFNFLQEVDRGGKKETNKTKQEG